MEYLISAIWFALELIYCLHFWRIFLPRTATMKRSVITLVLAWIFTFAYTNIGLNQLIKTGISFAVYFIMVTLLFEGTWYRRILVVVMGYLVNGIIDTAFLYGFSLLLGISLAEFAWHQLLYVATVTLGKLFSIFLAWIFARFRAFRDYHAIQKKWLLLSMAFPLISLSMLIVIFYGYKDQKDLSALAFVFSCLLVAANIAIIYLIRIMERSTKNAQETALLKQQMVIQTESIVALEKSYRTQRKTTHDFRNQLQTIDALLIKGNMSAAQEYIQQIQGVQLTRVFTANSNHPIIDAILNTKYQLAQEHNIDVHVSVNDLAGVRLGTDILVVLLSNLLDNAIEACLKLPDNRCIQCRILLKDSTYISIRNTSLPVLISGDSIPTTKEPKDEHGYGIPRIQYILKQLYAESTFTYDNGWFEFVADIPNN